jgi:hypothetical protein
LRGQGSAGRQINEARPVAVRQPRAPSWADALTMESGLDGVDGLRASPPAPGDVQAAIAFSTASAEEDLAVPEAPHIR